MTINYTVDIMIIVLPWWFLRMIIIADGMRSIPSSCKHTDTVHEMG